jgi:hypothetical protein
MYKEISDLGLFVQTSPYGLGLHKKDLGPIFLCIRIYYYMASITSGEMADCDWLRSIIFP